MKIVTTIAKHPVYISYIHTYDYIIVIYMVFDIIICNVGKMINLFLYGIL